MLHCLQLTFHSHTCHKACPQLSAHSSCMPKGPEPIGVPSQLVCTLNTYWPIVILGSLNDRVRKLGVFFESAKVYAQETCFMKIASPWDTPQTAA